MKNRILVVTAESPDTWAARLAQTLKPLGTVEFVAEGGLESEEFVKSCALIIVDAVVASPDKLISELRSWLPNGRIVVMTASPTWQGARDAFAAGALDYLSKNLEGPELLAAVETLLTKPLPPLAREFRST